MYILYNRCLLEEYYILNKHVALFFSFKYLLNNKVCFPLVIPVTGAYIADHSL